MRLITRADFDGLACGAILLEAGLVDSWKFVHPKDLQDGKIEVTKNDVLTNVPYVEGCGMWFDHHASQIQNMPDGKEIPGVRRLAPSCAEIIYEYYGGVGKFPHLEDMVIAANKVDSADLTLEDIEDPQGWVLLGFIMDPRTGLGRINEFQKGNWELMEDMLNDCRDFDIDILLMLPDVAERVEFYRKQADHFKSMLKEYSWTKKDVVVTDLRGVSPIYTGNRFLLYSIFREQNISIWIVDGFSGNCVIAVGHSILNRTSTVDVGTTMAKYGGGGHTKVGTCQVSHDDVDGIIKELVEFFNSHEYNKEDE